MSRTHKVYAKIIWIVIMVTENCNNSSDHVTCLVVFNIAFVVAVVSGFYHQRLTCYASVIINEYNSLYMRPAVISKYFDSELLS